jgi:hypothetical protein
MDSIWQNYQTVDINNDTAKCTECGARITHIPHFKYDGKNRSGATYREELCKCSTCNTKFIMHYDLFDSEGHIFSKVFTGDINDPNYNWQDSLTQDQKKAISEHLKSCPKCQDRLSEEILSDAWLSNVMDELRKKNNII